MKISCIHPTREREKVAAAWRVWLEQATGEHVIEHIICLDDDQVLDGWCVPPEQSPLSTVSKICYGPRGGSVAAYNRGLYASTGDIIVQVMDDLIPPLRWNSVIVDRLLPVDQPKLLHVSDGTELHKARRIPLLTVLIGTRSYFTKCGYMYHPDYWHTHGDDDQSEKAYREGLVVEATDLTFRHAWQGAERDQVARLNYSPHAVGRGRRALVARRNLGFPDEPWRWPEGALLP